MKQYPVSSFYNKIYYICLLLLLAYEALLLLILDSTNLAPMDYIDFSIGILGIIIISFILSYLSSNLAVFSSISEGTRIIILTIVISLAAAVLFPVKEEEDA